MGDEATLQERADEVRDRTIELVDTLQSQAAEFDLPEPPDLLLESAAKLQEDEYTVMVIGEAKRGKSSFINALVGRHILPTNVDIATSQVFKVSRSQQEAYRLRFEDASTQTVDVTDLPKYGSQVVADAGDAPRLDQIIRWIEADVPATFIPEGISIVDTPGLGGLYAAHAQITQRFVPHADAVIVVLDSTQPMGQPEIEIIEHVLEATQNIFFIQTKIDLFRRDDWQAVQQRSEAILEEHFGGRLTDTRIWPISSTNLMDAAETGDEMSLMVSRHKELAAALKAFLFRVSGWARTAETLGMAQEYHGRGTSLTNERLKALNEDSKQKREELRDAMTELRNGFAGQWGPKGEKRREVLEEVHRILAIGRREMQQALQSGGEIEEKARKRIEALGDLSKAERLADETAEIAVTNASEKWKGICDQVVQRVATIIEPFEIARMSLERGQQADGDLELDGAIQFSSRSEQQDDTTAALRGLLMGGGIGGLAKPVAAFVFGPVIGGIAVVGGILFGLVHSLEVNERRELAEARRSLLKHLSAVMRHIHRYFFGADATTGHGGVVDEYCRSFERHIREGLSEAADRASEDTKRQLHRLEEAVQMNDEERKAAGRRLHQRKMQWSTLGGEMKAIATELRALDAEHERSGQERSAD